MSSRFDAGRVLRGAGAAPVAAVLIAVVALACGFDAPPPPDPAAVEPTPAVAQFLTQIYPILETKCLACHHDAVEMPWYAALPGMGDPVRRDIEWGRERFDLSRPYPFLEPTHAHQLGGRAYLYALRTAILDDAMPPFLYWVTHPGSGLSDAEKQRILEWIDLALSEWAAPAESAPLAIRVEDLLRNRCARCHNDTVDDDMNGGFDYVWDVAFLAEDEDYVVSEDAEGSPLFERLVDDKDRMPPSPNDALSEDEIELVREWIDEGAPVP